MRNDCLVDRHSIFFDTKYISKDAQRIERRTERRKYVQQRTHACQQKFS